MNEPEFNSTSFEYSSDTSEGEREVRYCEIPSFKIEFEDSSDEHGEIKEKSDEKSRCAYENISSFQKGDFKKPINYFVAAIKDKTIKTKGKKGHSDTGNTSQPNKIFDYFKRQNKRLMI